MSATESSSPQQPSRTKESVRERGPIIMYMKGSNLIKEVPKLVAHGRTGSAKSKGPLEARAEVPCEQMIHEGHAGSIP